MELILSAQFFTEWILSNARSEVEFLISIAYRPLLIDDWICCGFSQIVYRVLHLKLDFLDLRF